MACIYEVFNIYNFSNEASNMCLDNIYRMNIGDKALNSNGKEISLHNAIVYGVDSIVSNDGIYIVSCSFYDNLIMFWKI
jgi:hypothetical protein